MFVSACGQGRRPTEVRLSTAWYDVQKQFDRMAAFQLEFRAAATSVAHKPEAERLQFIRQALDQRYELELGLKRELQRFTKTASAEPQSARLPYAKKLRLELDKIAALQAGSGPAFKALALDKFEEELNVYQKQRDEEFIRAK